MNDVVIIIPAYNPDQKFISFLKDLTEAGYDKIIIINDGSKEETQTYFTEAVERYGCDLVAHSINLGQGRAYKSGFNQYLLKAGRGVLMIIQSVLFNVIVMGSIRLKM